MFVRYMHTKAGHGHYALRQTGKIKVIYANAIGSNTDFAAICS